MRPFVRTFFVPLALVLSLVASVADAGPRPPVGARVRFPGAQEGRWTIATCERASADSLWLALDRDGTTRAYARAEVAGIEMAAGSRPSARKATALGIAAGAVTGAVVGWVAGRPGESEGGEGGGEDDDRELARLAVSPAASAATPAADHSRFDAAAGAVIGGIAGGLVGALTGLGQYETAWSSVELTGAMPRAARGAGAGLALRFHWR